MFGTLAFLPDRAEISLAEVPIAMSANALEKFFLMVAFGLPVTPATGFFAAGFFSRLVVSPADCTELGDSAFAGSPVR